MSGFKLNENKEEINNLENDLKNVEEKVKLCREILLVSPGIQNDEALAEVIGFLEACRDRMPEIIEAGTQGLLTENAFALCLQVNDDILKTLDAEKNGTPIPVEHKFPTKSNQNDSEDLLDFGNNVSSIKSIANSNKNNNGLVMVDDDDDDEFSSLTLKVAKKVGIGSASTAIKKTPQSNVKSTIPLIAPPPNKSKHSDVNKITNNIDLLDLNDNIIPLNNNNNNNLLNNDEPTFYPISKTKDDFFEN